MLGAVRGGTRGKATGKMKKTRVDLLLEDLDVGVGERCRMVSFSGGFGGDGAGMWRWVLGGLLLLLWMRVLRLLLEVMGQRLCREIKSLMMEGL
jgi:hypothetical protein